MKSIDLIAFERNRQITQEGWTAEHDDKYEDDELARAAAFYTLPLPFRTLNTAINTIWPWVWEWWKPTPNNRIRELVKAGALICAEIDRLQRK